MIDLRTSYMGLELRTPLVASSSPLTRTVESCVALSDHGISAVVLPSLFEEQIVEDALEVDALLNSHFDLFAEAGSFLPELDDYNTGPDRYLSLVDRIRDAVDVPVIASLNGTTLGGWTKHALLLQEAGAHAIELNVYLVAADVDTTSREIEDRIVALVESVRHEVTVPLAVKMGPHFTALGHLAKRIVEAGADGLVFFNRFYQPQIDLDEMEVVPKLRLSTPEELPLVLRWIGMLHGAIPASFGATTGIHTVEDVVRCLMAGADVTMLASSLLLGGPGKVRELEEGLAEWLGSRGYVSVTQMKGSMSRRAISRPEAYERANYIETLANYSDRHRV